MRVAAGEYVVHDGEFWLEFGLCADDGVVDAVLAAHRTTGTVYNYTHGPHRANERDSWNSRMSPFEIELSGGDRQTHRIGPDHPRYDDCCRLHMICALGEPDIALLRSLAQWRN